MVPDPVLAVINAVLRVARDPAKIASDASQIGTYGRRPLHFSEARVISSVIV
jgi:hypothetical protein